MQSHTSSPHVRRVVKTLAIAAAALSVFATAACSTNTKSENSATAGTSSSLKVYFITHAGQGDTFWTSVQNGAQAAAKEQGASLVYEAANGDVQKQTQMIRSATAAKPAAIVTSLPDPNAFTGPIGAAIAAKVPVFSVNSGTSAYTKTGSLGHAGEDEYIAGQGVGKRFVSLGKKHVLCVLQERNNIGLDNYCNGIKNTFSGKTSTLYVNGLSDLSGTQQQLKAALASDKSVDAVYTLNAAVTPLALAAAQQDNVTPTIATWTLSPDVLKEIEAGKVAFAEDQQPFLEGYLSTTMAVQYVKYGVRPASAILTGPNFITKDNAAQVLALSKKGIR